MEPKRKETVTKESFDLYKESVAEEFSSLTSLVHELSKKLDSLQKQERIIEILVENPPPAESAPVSAETASDISLVNSTLPVWHKPRNPLKMSTSVQDIPRLTTANRFAPLDDETCSLPDRFDEQILEPTIIPQRSEVVTSQPSRSRRPEVVVNSFPENETRYYPPVMPGTFLENRMQSSQPPPVMPGARLYSKEHDQDTLILSDSMCNRINRKQLIKNLNENEENVVIKKFPGANSADISHYATHHLNKVRPHRFIAVCGTNDLPEHWGEKLSEWEIASQIAKIGQVARQYGVNEIYLSSIINRQGVFYAQKLKKVNSILETMCMQQGFNFLNHSDIHAFYHLDQGGLHLNVFGTCILKMNILKCFNTFNPYFNTFLRTYERAF